MTIKDTIHMFEQLAQQAHFQTIPEALLKQQSQQIQDALKKNDNQKLKAIYCQPEMLANKTTIFNY